MFFCALLVGASALLPISEAGYWQAMSHWSATRASPPSAHSQSTQVVRAFFGTASLPSDVGPVWQPPTLSYSGWQHQMRDSNHMAPTSNLLKKQHTQGWPTRLRAASCWASAGLLALLLSVFTILKPTSRFHRASADSQQNFVILSSTGEHTTFGEIARNKPGGLFGARLHPSNDILAEQKAWDTETPKPTSKILRKIAALSKSDLDEPDSEFRRLASMAGIDHLVDLRWLPDYSTRGLFARRDVDPGDALLHVPEVLCIVEPVDLPAGMDGGPQQTWDVRLAERFLDEIAVGQFWHPYAELVPAPGTMAQPLQLPPSLLEELHHNTMAAAARKQQAALRHQVLVLEGKEVQRTSC